MRPLVSRGNSCKPKPYLSSLPGISTSARGKAGEREPSFLAKIAERIAIRSQRLLGNLQLSL
jgi:hypothetical protein